MSPESFRFLVPSRLRETKRLWGREWPRSLRPGKTREHVTVQKHVSRIVFSFHHGCTSRGNIKCSVVEQKQILFLGSQNINAGFPYGKTATKLGNVVETYALRMFLETCFLVSRYQMETQANGKFGPAMSVNSVFCTMRKRLHTLVSTVPLGQFIHFICVISFLCGWISLTRKSHKTCYWLVGYILPF